MFSVKCFGSVPERSNGTDCHRILRGAASGGINLLAMYIVYILFSSIRNKYYIGHTENLEKRLSRHNNGLVRSTKSGVPWSLIYKENKNTKNEAYGRELQIKSYKGGLAFKNLINSGSIPK